MMYGNPAWEHIERIRNDVNLRQWISAGHFIPLLQMTPPCEMTTQRELWHLVDRSKTVTPERLEAIKAIDRDLAGVWARYLDSLGVVVPVEEVQSVMDRYEAIVDYLKIKFNRARPFQAAGYFGIPLYPRLRTDASDSSYPSGHTFLSLCIYHHYVTLHPDLNKELMLMVLKVKQSREDGGVHYPSDGLFAFQVYHHLKDVIFPHGHGTIGLPNDGTAYVESPLIPDIIPVTDYVKHAREIGQGVGAVAQGEPKHMAKWYTYTLN